MNDVTAHGRGKHLEDVGRSVPGLDAFRLRDPLGVHGRQLHESSPSISARAQMKWGTTWVKSQ